MPASVCPRRRAQPVQAAIGHSIRLQASTRTTGSSMWEPASVPCTHSSTRCHKAEDWPGRPGFRGHGQGRDFGLKLFGFGQREHLPVGVHRSNSANCSSGVPQALGGAAPQQGGPEQQDARPGLPGLEATRHQPPPSSAPPTPSGMKTLMVAPRMMMPSPAFRQLMAATNRPSTTSRRTPIFCGVPAASLARRCAS